jgi:hypothetical protein
MDGFLDTAGERLQIACAIPWVTELIAEGAGGELRQARGAERTLRVFVEREGRPFETGGWQLLTRGAWRSGHEVVIENVGTTGFDLHLSCTPELAEFTFRWRPPSRDRIAALLLRSRFHLLARAVLMQYPVMWWAGIHGRAPLHASAFAAASSTPLLTAPGGIGRTTLVLAELDAGGRATADNLTVGDGRSVWSLVEPVRSEGGEGRRMPHGRNEGPLRDRAASLVPDCLVVLKRGRLEHSSLSTCSAETAARSLITSTYMAGELRRYWPLAATLAAATGLGPPHAPITDVAWTFAGTLPCFSYALGSVPGARLSELLDAAKVAA